MTDTSAQDTIQPRDDAATGNGPAGEAPAQAAIPEGSAPPDVEMDFSGWDKQRWREYRRAQKDAYKQACRQEKARVRDAYLREGGWKDHGWDEDEWESHWRDHAESDPLGALTWAAIFVWAGMVLLANNLGFLNEWVARFALPTGGIDRFSMGAFSIVFLGVAAILLLQVALRLLFPALYRPVVGSLILAGILAGVGLDGVIAWNIAWPVILILLGAYIIFGGALHRKD